MVAQSPPVVTAISGAPTTVSGAPVVAAPIPQAISIPLPETPVSLTLDTLTSHVQLWQKYSPDDIPD